MGILIIGQAMTMQNMQGMKYIPDIYEGLSDGASALYHYNYVALYNRAFIQGISLYNQASNQATEYGSAAKTELQQKTNAVINTLKDTYTELYNVATAHEQFRTKPVFRLIPGIGVCDAICDGTKALYNYDYATLYNNASTQGRALYNNVSDKATEYGPIVKDGIHDGATALHTWYTNDAPHFHDILREALTRDFWTRAFATGKNNAIQCFENIKNLPNTIELAIDNKIEHKAKDFARNALGLDQDAPVDANVIKREIRNNVTNEAKDAARNAAISLTKYAAIVSAGLFTAYKTYTYCVNKYQEYQKAHALDESIKQHLTDEKKAEIAQLTGKELSANDLQEIINNIKTHATAAEDGHATQAIVDLVIKEYVNKQANV